MNLSDKNLKTKGAAVVCFLSMTLLGGCFGRMSTEELRMRGIEQMQAGDYEAASASFAEALDFSRGKVGEIQYDILKYRAENSFKLEDYAGASETYKKLKELDSDPANQSEYDLLIITCDAAVANQRGKELMESGDYEGALAEFERGLALGDMNMSRLLRFNRACCYEYMGDYETALSEFTSYIQEYPDDEEAMKEYNFLRTRAD